MGISVGIGAYKRYRDAAAHAYELDPLLLWPAVALLLLGLVMVYSASISYAASHAFTGHSPTYFLVRHAVFLVVGTVAAAFVFQVPMRVWQQLAPSLFIIGLVMLVAVTIPGVGREVNGARRWIPLGPVNVQPAEVMKLVVVLYAAGYTVRKLADMGSFTRGFLPMAVVIALLGGLLLRQPDFGSFVVITVIGFAILFLGGINARLFFGLASVLVTTFGMIIWMSPYRRTRLMSFLNPWDDPLKSDYQLSNALIAFGRGEIFGVGLGGSVQKLDYLPEAHTDFLLAVIGEELGLVGVAVVMLLFALVVHRAFAIGKQALVLERVYSGLVAQGIGIWLGFQAFINMGVNTGLLPTKGLTLPLMSFGGSGIVANCVALGVLLRVDWENRRLMRGLPA